MHGDLSSLNVVNSIQSRLWMCQLILQSWQSPDHQPHWESAKWSHKPLWLAPSQDPSRRVTGHRSFADWPVGGGVGWAVSKGVEPGIPDLRKAGRSGRPVRIHSGRSWTDWSDVSVWVDECVRRLKLIMYASLENVGRWWLVSLLAFLEG